MKRFRLLPFATFIVFTIFLTSGCAKGQESQTESEIEAQEATSKETESVISKVSTPLLDVTSNRVKNIKKAIEKVNKITIKPGETFSFNGAIGIRKKDTGFFVAPTLKGKKKSKGYGGGICQLSTTLYQAAKNAGLEITEVHRHQKPVKYSKKNEDATVAYGVFDLKIKNNKTSPIRFVCNCNQKSVEVEVFSTQQ